MVQDLVEFIRPGLKERDIKKRIEELCLKRGHLVYPSNPIASDPIVLCLITTVTRGYSETRYVFLDLGCKYNGYCSDTTRTLFIGEPGEKEKSV